ncbi:MAG: MarR family transcriptional regulator [Lachnospiraceae bacterium]|nr:MarR family transcriptional regulator [Lachnospiraceae bacterium]
MRNDKVAILIKRAALEFDKIANPVLAEYGLTASQYRILKFLYTQPEESARIVDIERDCQITHPTVLGIIVQLENKGFVRKLVNPDDARSKIVSLSDKTKGMKDELEAVGTRLDDQLTENLTDKERARLLVLLQKLLGVESEVSL